MPPDVPRRTALHAVAGLAVAATAVACTTEDGSAPPQPAPSATPDRPARHVVRLATGTSTLGDGEPTVAASRALLSEASAVVVSSDHPDDLAVGNAVAVAAGIPLLVDGPEVAAELSRLGTRTVLRADAAAGGTPSDLGDREVVTLGPGAQPEVPGLPATPADGRAVVLLAPDHEPSATLDPLFRATRAEVLRLEQRDPRAAATDITAVRKAPSEVVLGLGGFGPHLAQRVRTVRHAPELPGGGLLPYPGRRMVALYGHPLTAALGMLGEQSARDAAARARRLAEEYAPLVDEPVVPAFELIATVASGGAGSRGDYSNRTPEKDLARWVDVAQDEGIYVVLDLQPGRADFLDQAKLYERLLRRPHVGLALDPEWRLGPGEKPLQRIGSVGVDEVNRVGRWLAELVRDHDLPPKVLTLHQFRTSMIRGRERLDTSLDEIQWLVHADGQGGQNQKQGTWAALREDLPEGVWLGWKNFEDEDEPMLTPEGTVATVSPTPWFVSYQ